MRALAVERIGFVPVTCPTAPSLEAEFYRDARTIAATAYDMVRGEAWMPEKRDDLRRGLQWTVLNRASQPFCLLAESAS
jgi:hypothetical protein